MRLIALILSAGLLLVPTAPALAYSGPGACLAVNNRSGYTLSIRVTVPSLYDDGSRWEAVPDERFLLSYKGNLVVSTTEKNDKGGNFWIRWSGGTVRDAWNYDADRNVSKGCVGTWTVTFYPE